MLHAFRVALVSIAVLLACGCGGERERAPRTETKEEPARLVAGLSFVPASADLLAQCRRTARQVGYPVPCPTRVPEGLTATIPVAATGCALEIIGPGGIGGCGKSWRGWVIGSSEVEDQHLVITASPTHLTNPAKIVNGPAWYPTARVRELRPRVVNRWRTRAVYAVAATNAGSAFSNHVVLIWSVGGHTYGVGFHNVRGRRQTLRLDEAVVRSIRLVTP